MRVEPIKDLDIIKDIISYLDTENKRDSIMFQTGVYTGLRISDILKLRVKDVYNKKVLRVKQQKTGEYVEIPINIDLRREYKEFCNGKPQEEYLIKNQRTKYNKPIKRDRAYKILNKVADKFDLERIGTHTLRKCTGYHLYKNSNSNIGLVMRVLGQKNPASTLNYIGVNDVDVLRGINSLSFR